MPVARIIGRISETIVMSGANVFTPRGRGSVVDVRATRSCKFVIGVEVVSGAEIRSGEGSPARTELITT